MPVLPTPGADTGVWGQEVNDYLAVSHAADGTHKVANAAWYSARNAANNADVNLFRLDSSDRLQLGAQLYRSDDATGFGESGSFLRFRRIVSNYTGLVQGMDMLHDVIGIGTVAERFQALRINVRDKTGTVNKTITGMTHVGTTVTVTATSHGFANGDRVAIYGVTHTFNAEVNGAWTIANVTTNTFDMIVSGLSTGSYTSGGTVTNRSMYYGIEVDVAPAVDRGSLTGTAAHADDIAAYVAYNGSAGAKKATEAFYLGGQTGISAPDWNGGFSSSTYVLNWAFGGDGRIANGGACFEANHMTYDAGSTPLRLPKDVYVTAADFGGVTNQVNLFKYVNASNWIEMGTGLRIDGSASTVYALDLGSSTSTAAQLHLKNNKAVSAVNGAATADINIFKLNASDRLELMSDIEHTDGKNIVVGTGTGTKIGTATTQKLSFWGKSPTVQQPPAYTLTNVTTDRSYDANATSIDELADALGTLVADLQSMGLVG